MTEAPTTVHGRLLEAVHLAGYSFERAWHQLEWLLEEHRWQQVEPGYTEVNAFLATIKLPEGISAEQRKKVAAQIKRLQPEASQRKIAGVLGVDQATIHHDLKPRKQPKAKALGLSHCSQRERVFGLAYRGERFSTAPARKRTFLLVFLTYFTSARSSAFNRIYVVQRA